MRVLRASTLSLIGAGALAAAIATSARAEDRPLRLTIQVVRADLHNVLRLIADVSRLNIVVGEDVHGQVTLHLRNVPWTEALDAVLASQGLGMERMGSVVQIAPLKVLAEEAKTRESLAKSRRETAPLVTRIIPVSYARAEELLPHVKTLLSPRGTATIDARTNVLIVTDVQ